MKTTNQGASTKNNTSAKKIAFAAIIAALYAALTYASSFMSFGAFQFRVAEGLTVLPFFSFYAIPGLFIGCLISNFLSPVGPLDIVIGSGATLLAAFLTYLIGKSKIKGNKLLAPLPPVIVNAIIIGIMLKILYIPEMPLYLCMVQVGLGQAVCCYGIGLPIIYVIEKNPILKKYLS